MLSFSLAVGISSSISRDVAKSVEDIVYIYLRDRLELSRVLCRGILAWELFSVGKSLSIEG